MSWVIGGITLPFAPSRVIDKLSAEVKAAPYPADLPMILSIGDKARVLEIEGIFAEAGQGKAHLETTYIIPFRGKVHTVVTVSAPDTRYDGDWLLESFSYEERSGVVRAFYYKMVLWKGRE